MLPAGSLYAVYPDPANAIGASTGLEENPSKIRQTVRSEHPSCPLPPGTWTFRKGPFSVVVFGIVAPNFTEYAIRAERDKLTAPGTGNRHSRKCCHHQSSRAQRGNPAIRVAEWPYERSICNAVLSANEVPPKSHIIAVHKIRLEV